jgi:sortase A
LVLSAHNDIYGKIFRYLDQLQEGDEIIVETQRQTYTYRVAYWRVVAPTEISVLEQTAEPIVTLISCYPYLVNSDRIVVIAELAP